MRQRDITAALATGLAGSERCQAPDCGRADGSRCAYTDDGGNRCPSAWCPDHIALIDGQAYCLRHAGTMRALDGATIRPGLENRCPSLVHCVGREIDLGIRGCLNDVRYDVMETLVATRVRMINRDAATVWRQSWTLRAEEIDMLEVAVEVDEALPTTVTVTVQGKPAVTRIPYWIAERRPDHPELTVDEVQDAHRRFSQDLIEETRAVIRVLRRLG